MSICELDFTRIEEWRDWCLSHEISLEEILQMSKGLAPLIGNRSSHVLYLPIGFRFVFSIENTPSKDFKNVYRIRRLSGSLDKPGKYPTPILMQTISEKLGFGPFDNCIIRINDTDPIPNIEINEVIEIKPI
jgi:hypothetical protein